MLLNARLSNFRSFEGVTQLCMVSSSKIQNLKNEHVEITQDARILKYAELFGPNASGKSNLVQFFVFVKRFLVNGFQHKMLRSMKECYCRTSLKNADQPSAFELQMYLNGRAVSYGFSVSFKNLQILEEYLSLDSSDGRRNILYHRNDSHIYINRDYFTGRDWERMDIYKRDYGMKKNISFLGFLNDSKEYEPGTPGSVLSEVYDFITKSIILISPQSKLNIPFSGFSENALLDRMREFLSCFDTGVTDIRTVAIDQRELENRIGEDAMEYFERFLYEQDEGTEITVRSENNLYCIKKDPLTLSLICETVQFQHNKDNWFNFSEESDGTVRLFDLSPLILDNTINNIYIVDELDRSLHTKTIERLLNMFEKSNQSKRNQLIFTTHDTDLMDQKKFRRDEIWLIERDERNVSHLYSLDRFKERGDKDLRKGYLEGRYGALPVFKDEGMK